MSINNIAVWLNLKIRKVALRENKTIHHLSDHLEKIVSNRSIHP